MGNCLTSWFSCFHSSNITPANFTSSDANPSSVAQPTTTTTATTSTEAPRSQLFSGTTASTSDGIDSENENSTPAADSGRILESPSLKVYSFSDMKTATRNFKSDTLLGQGGFGKVYRGWVDERSLAPCKPGIGIAVAIKKLNDESMQGFEEWQSEVNFLGRLSHPNLVKLLGYCWEDKELLLVYEFVQKGSLENHLFRRNATVEPLPWDLRVRIATGAARGLAFLHTSDKQIIYRDFKASNILLDANYNAKISDFGLAKSGPAGGESHVTTRIMGTYGYVAPEYIATGHLYVKSDVYGFGVVLLELMTGLRAVDTTRPNGQQNLVDWLRPILSQKRKLRNVMDARVEGQYSSKAMVQAAQIALKCLEPDPKTRPSMKEVVDDLEKIQAIKDKPMASKRGSGSGSGSGSNRSGSAHCLPGRPEYYHHYPTPLN